VQKKFDILVKQWATGSILEGGGLKRELFLAYYSPFANFLAVLRGLSGQGSSADCRLALLFAVCVLENSLNKFALKPTLYTSCIIVKLLVYHYVIDLL
jgi:hypothetical protein